MKKSSNILPFAIILSTIIIVSVGILIKNTSQNLTKNYDIFGMSYLNLFFGSDYKNQFPTNTNQSNWVDNNDNTENTQPELNNPERPIKDNIFETSYSKEDFNLEDFQDNIPPPPDGLSTSNTDSMHDAQPSEKDNHSKDNALAIKFNQKQSAELKAGKSNWYKFTTGAEIAVYRLESFPTIENFTESTYIYLRTALYDSNGIKIDDFLVHCHDEYNFLDLYLNPNTEYFVKLYGTDFGNNSKAGSYEFCISEMVCDAGINKENPTKIELGNQQIAIIDSTLSDWYVFEVTKTSNYKVTLHNISVGCDIYLSMDHTGQTKRGAYVSNEDNYSCNISANEEDLVYFEIFPYKKNPTANGKYILIIEQEIT